MGKRIVGVSGVVLAALAITLFFSHGVLAESATPTTAQSQDDLQRSVEAILARHLPEVRFDHVALSDAIDFLGDVSGGNIYLDWNALSAAGIKRDAPVTYSKNDVAFRQCLADILHNLGGTQAATSGVVGNVIVISTAGGMKEITEENETVPAKIDDAKLQALLDRRLPDLKFDAVSFSDVIDFLRDLSGANIYADWPGLEAAGINRNAPITFRVRDVPIREVLALVLHSADGNPPARVGVVGKTIVLSTAGRIKALTEEVDAIPLKIDDAKLQAQLDKPLPDLKFDGIGFSDVIDFLHDITGANIRADWPGLEAAGINRNAPITLRLRDVPLRESIVLIVNQASTTKGTLAVSIEGGTIKIVAKNVP